MLDLLYGGVCVMTFHCIIGLGGLDLKVLLFVKDTTWYELNVGVWIDWLLPELHGMLISRLGETAETGEGAIEAKIDSSELYGILISRLGRTGGGVTVSWSLRLILILRSYLS